MAGYPVGYDHVLQCLPTPFARQKVLSASLRQQQPFEHFTDGAAWQCF